MNKSPTQLAAPSSHSRSSGDSALTLFLTGGIAFITAALAHETIGHGLATVIMGGKVLFYASGYLWGTLGGRFIDIAGPLNNLIVGTLFHLLLRHFRKASTGKQMFLWMATFCNLLWGTGYLIYAALLNEGDWIALIRGLEPQWFWRSLMALVGVVSYGACVWNASRELNRIVSASSSRQTALRSMWAVGLAYLGAGVTACWASLLDPFDASWALWNNAAPASFLAESGLLLTPLLGYFAKNTETANTSSPVSGNYFQLACYAMAISSFIMILGHGIKVW